MAYQVPPAWSHGDVPTAAKMNTYSNGQSATKALLDVSDKNVTSPVFDGDEDDAIWVFTHLNRYLIYDDECDVYEYGGISNSNRTSLTEPPEGEIGIYDLDAIGWLTYGMRYVVEGTAWAIEDYEP